MENRIRIMCDADKRHALIAKFGYNNILFLSPTIEEMEFINPPTTPLRET